MMYKEQCLFVLTVILVGFMHVCVDCRYTEDFYQTDYAKKPGIDDLLAIQEVSYKLFRI